MPLDIVYTGELLATASVLLLTRLAHLNGPPTKPQLTPPPQALSALWLHPRAGGNALGESWLQRETGLQTTLVCPGPRSPLTDLGSELGTPKLLRDGHP